MSFPVLINGRLSDVNTVKLRNIASSSAIDGISIHIEPLLFSTNFDGFNEAASGMMWLMEPRGDSQPKVQIRIDNVVTYGISKNTQGNKATNPLIYFRSGLAGHTTIHASEDIQPLFSISSSAASGDWADTIEKQGLNSRTLLYEEYQYEDFINIEVIINASETTETALYNNIKTYLANNSMITIRPTLMNKPIVSIYELMFDDTYQKYTNEDGYNIRF